jgi:hypothetical protein
VRFVIALRITSAISDVGFLAELVAIAVKFIEAV